MKRSRKGAAVDEGIGEDVSSNGSYESDQDALAALEAHFAQRYDVPAMKTSRGGKEKQKECNTYEPAAASQASDRTLIKHPFSYNPRKTVQTVVFGEADKYNTSASGSTDTPNGWRKFMSSKVATRTDDEKKAERLASKKETKTKQIEKDDGEGGDEDQDEKAAQTNDRALSNLLSTTLFAPGGAGSTTKRSNGKPILGSNDTLARLLELSQPSMNGKVESQGRGYGTALLKSQEMGKMPVEIRHGMRRAEMQNQEKHLQRQKELGNYHHSIKDLVTKREGLDLVLGTKSKDRAKRTRDKGLSMGVGKFSGGMLRLSEQEIQKINKPSTKGHSHKRKR